MSIEETAVQAVNLALQKIELEHPDYDARKACAKIVAEKIQQTLLIRHDAHDFGSRPRW